MPNSTVVLIWGRVLDVLPRVSSVEVQGDDNTSWPSLSRGMRSRRIKVTDHRYILMETFAQIRCVIRSSTSGITEHADFALPVAPSLWWMPVVVMPSTERNTDLVLNYFLILVPGLP